MLARLIAGTMAVLAGACVSQPAPPERAAPSPLCAVNTWRGFEPVRRFRLAPMAFGGERPRDGPELTAACALAKGPIFEIEGAEADVAAGVWMALGYNTARIRRESSYLGYAIERDPASTPNYDWRPPANAFDIFRDITSIRAAVSNGPACAERAGLRCLELTIYSGDPMGVSESKKLSLVFGDQGWRLADYSDVITFILME